MIQARSMDGTEVLLPTEEEAAGDFRKAAVLASGLRALGAPDMALVWERLAVFLQDSENYIFQTETLPTAPLPAL